MVKANLLLVFTVAAVSVRATEDELLKSSSNTAVKAMEKVFLRSDSSYKQSLAARMQAMTSDKAWQVLEKMMKKSNVSTSTLAAVKGNFGKQSSLRKASPKGYAGVEGARLMLNQMIYESMEKYDQETSGCSSFYNQQCDAMDAMHSQIAASNAMNAHSRKLVTEAENRIAQMRVDIPEAQKRLREHLHSSRQQLDNMNAHLESLENDIAILSRVLQMTSCKKEAANAVKLLQCEDVCTKRNFTTIDHDEVLMQLDKLKSSASKDLVEGVFHDVFKKSTSAKPVSMIQQHGQLNHVPEAPLLSSGEPMFDPCTSESAGLHILKSKRANKCTLTSTGCSGIQQQFLQIQSSILDEKTGLKDTMMKSRRNSDNVKDTLTSEIKHSQRIAFEATASLSKAMASVAQSSAVRRTTAEQHKELTDEMKRRMDECNQNYLNLENEMCALRKIRAQLYLMQGSGHSAHFQDCEVGQWVEQECSAECEGGEQELRRSIEAPSNGGAKCLPLTEKRRCNTKPCPVNCKLGRWEGWSKCTAECGGGVQSRMNQVVRAAMHGGKDCGVTDEMRSCNTQACDKDCELGSWTKWSSCSKDCGGGTSMRSRYVLSQAVGEGECAGERSDERLQYRACHTHKCPAHLTCSKQLDIVLVLDGSSSVDAAGWDAEKLAAQNLVDRFNVNGTKAKIAVVVYSGPHFSEDVLACENGKITNQSFCGINVPVPMDSNTSSNLPAVKSTLAALKLPQGSTLMSMGLNRAKAEVDMGRPDAKAVVIAMTSGHPFSMQRTIIAAKAVRKKARLLMVPIVRYAPLKLFKLLVTRRWEENMVAVNEFAELRQPRVVNDIVANVCPHWL